MIRSAFIASVVTLVVVGGGARFPGSALALEPTWHSPYEWDCTYPYSDTTCEDVIYWWWQDQDASQEGEEFHERVACGRCEPEKVTDINNVEHVVGYKCDNQQGHYVVSPDLQAKLIVYAEAGPGAGWQVDDWILKKCLQSHNCHARCAINRTHPDCVATQSIGVGKWTPITSAACDDMSEDDTEDEPPTDEERDDDWVPTDPGSDADSPMMF